MDIYFDPNYAKVFKDIDGDSETFTFECSFGTVVNTYNLRKISWKIGGQTYYDIVTPYGYGGPYAKDVTDIKQLMSAYEKAFVKHCKCRNIVCEFIRFHLFDNIDIREYYYGEVKHSLDTVVVDTSGDYINKIWTNYNRKIRKNIRKALSNNLNIITDNTDEYLDEFLEIYYKTMDRNNASAFYYFKKDFFKNITRFLPENFMFFHVFKDDVMISTELTLCAEKYVYSFLGGTLKEFYEFRPNDYLKNEIIKWCNATGREKFILGGGYCLEDGIYKYKRYFTSDPDIPFYVGRHIFIKDIYDHLVNFRRLEDPYFDEESGYFPKYRSPQRKCL